ncbi:MAG: MBL fold metallo-hydrolase [Acidobacteriota bacterium]
MYNTRTSTIRTCGLLLALLGAWAAYTQTPQQGKQAPAAAKGKAPAPFNLVKVTDDLYVIDGGGAGNVAVYITSEGVILVDDKYEQHFNEIMDNVKKVTAQPVKYVINTHYHADHSGGNTHFAGIAQLISTTMARQNILNKVQPGAPDNMIPASITFKDEISVFLGGKEVRAMHLGRGHTGTDAFVYFPALRVLHSGDMVTNGSPLIDYGGGGSIVEWTKTLDKAMATFEFDTLIPGHGPVSPKTMMTTYRNNAETLRNRVAAEVRAGKSETDVAAFLTANFNWQPGSLQMERGLKGMMTELK